MKVGDLVPPHVGYNIYQELVMDFTWVSQQRGPWWYVHGGDNPAEVNTGELALCPPNTHPMPGQHGRIAPTGVDTEELVSTITRTCPTACWLQHSGKLAWPLTWGKWERWPKWQGIRRLSVLTNSDTTQDQIQSFATTLTST